MITQSAGLDLGLALLVGGLVGAVAAVIIGLPAARAGGLTLAIITLSLASATLYWLLNPEFFTWVPRGRFPDDPTLFGAIAIDTEQRFYALALAILALAIAILTGIRHSRTGRVLIALRENPRAAESYGVNAIRTMLSAFAFSGFIAAMAGVLFVHHQHGLSNAIGGNPFSPEASLRVFSIVRKQLKERGGQASFINMQPQITEVFEIIKALPGVAVFASEAEFDAYLTARQKACE